MPDRFPMSDKGFPPALSLLHGASLDNDGDIVPNEYPTPNGGFLPVPSPLHGASPNDFPMGNEGFPSLLHAPCPDNNKETMSNNSLEDDTCINDHDDEMNSETQDLEEGDDQVPFEDYGPSDEETQFNIWPTRSSCDKLAQSPRDDQCHLRCSI